MTEHRDDSILDRAADVLRELPPADRGAVGRIVAAAARARELDVEPHVDDLLAPPRPRTPWWPAAVAAAAAAGIMGFLAGHQQLGMHSDDKAAAVDAVAAGVGGAATTAAAIPAAGRALDQLPIPTQFVFDAPRAKRVALIGDFNGWDDGAAPLQREARSSLWSVTVPLGPGRHIYAFVVDSTWMTDPRAPRARDLDFGIAGSVIIVGKP